MNRIQNLKTLNPELKMFPLNDPNMKIVAVNTKEVLRVEYTNGTSVISECLEIEGQTPARIMELLENHKFLNCRRMDETGFFLNTSSIIQCERVRLVEVVEQKTLEFNGSSYEVPHYFLTALNHIIQLPEVVK